MPTSSSPVDAPIIIFSFTRPDYLRKLCESMKAQQGVSISDEQVHLLQDGSRSRRSGIVYGEPELIEASIATFREIFPRGHVHASPENLGIALNLHRGEKLAFDTLKAEVAYFFEEDLELGPCYLAMLEQLRRLLMPHKDIGYFAAYGDHLRASDPQAPKLVPMEHHWGFALTRRCWRAMQPWLKPFHEVYAQVDYQARPHLRIVELYDAKAVSSTASSQDVAKTMACADLGFARINTDVCYARYIGAQGESFKPANFEKLGFGSMAYVGSLPATLPAATPDIIAEIIATKRAACAAHRQTAYPAQLEEMRRHLFNPDRPVTREEIDWLWRLVMDRLPNDEAYYTQNVGQRTLRQIRRSLLRSKEAQGKGFYLA
ncbi:hypothetical protein J8J14_06985 [Roseomonas sp. SSH11]|uniref:Uncharacterized protein n=1 Tax=Pararoseomonas baculiformis TaxID=2820812 RepID=A0ABS4ABY8_9PROT|nr:hypothetical protein [Pararoseomonas baculiformis]MBP0444523.1 hypothetical protein [Pararoseomonas baculiformis]